MYTMCFYTVPQFTQWVYTVPQCIQWGYTVPQVKHSAYTGCIQYVSRLQTGTLSSDWLIHLCNDCSSCVRATSSGHMSKFK